METTDPGSAERLAWSGKTPERSCAVPRLRKALETVLKGGCEFSVHSVAV